MFNRKGQSFLEYAALVTTTVTFAVALASAIALHINGINLGARKSIPARALAVGGVTTQGDIVLEYRPNDGKSQSKVKTSSNRTTDFGVTQIEDDTLESTQETEIDAVHTYGH